MKALVVHVTVPPQQVSAENLRGDRNKNMELAKADRQAVFKGDCRSCHVDPGVGKLGKELYAADCGVCHDSHIRAAIVPDLRAPKAPRDRDYWVNWITYGRPGSMMPAFGEKDGGPLSKEQIDSLVKYLVENFPQGSAPVLAPAIAPAPTDAPKSGAGQ
jgi:mono/diheme cytochrome c family protein